MVTHTPQTDDAPLIVFAGGGTGGHLYPALGIVEALRVCVPGVRVAFFGTQRAIERHICEQAGCELVQQHLPPLRRAPWRWPGIYFGFRRSGRLCRQRLGSDPPLVVVGTGGLGSVPAVREAHRAGIPVALLNPDAIPGRANRFLARSADCVLAQWEETARYLPRATRVEVYGCPVRPQFNRAGRLAGVERFGLAPDLKTLLVTGASQGARTINETIVASLDFLETRSGWQVLHLTGELDHDMVLSAYRDRPLRSTVLAYTEHMADAMGAADLIVSRAGASSLAEITAVGRASILMPYPHHRDRHQFANARCLVRESAAVVVQDRIDPALHGPEFREVLGRLMVDDGARLALADAAGRMGKGNAAVEIAERLVSLAKRRGASGGVESLEASR